jgi:hypothetical protein
MSDLVTAVRAARPRRTLAMISSAVLCEMKGWGSSFQFGPQCDGVDESGNAGDTVTHLFEDDLEGLAGSMDARYGAALAHFGACCGPLGEDRKGRHTKGFTTFCPRSSGDRAPIS